MHYYSRNIGDYLKDTNGLSLIEHGAYGLLLDWAYANEKPLPLEEERLHRICCAVTKQDRQAVKAVLVQFWTLEKDGWTHKRVIKEIRKYYNKKESGAANVGKRWHQTDTNDDTNLDTNEDTKLVATEPTTITRVSRTKNQEPRTISEGAGAPPVPAELALESEVDHDDPDKTPAAKKKKGGAARERNALLDALAVVGGGSADTVTMPMWGAAAKALSYIKAVCGDVTPEMINAAASAYRREWPKASLSPSALAKHWSKFAPNAKKEGGRDDLKREPDWDWRALSAEIYGAPVTVPWSDMLERMRQEILTHHKLS